MSRQRIVVVLCERARALRSGEWANESAVFCPPERLTERLRATNACGIDIVGPRVSLQSPWETYRRILRLAGRRPVRYFGPWGPPRRLDESEVRREMRYFRALAWKVRACELLARALRRTSHLLGRW